MPGAEGGISHARGQRDVSSPRPSGTREPAGGSACQPLHLVPARASPVQPVSRCAGTWRSQVAKAGGLPKPTGDSLVFLQGRGAWGHQGDRPHSWQGLREFPQGVWVSGQRGFGTAVSSRACWSWPGFLLRPLIVSWPVSALMWECVHHTDTAGIACPYTFARGLPLAAHSPLS